MDSSRCLRLGAWFAAIALTVFSGAALQAADGSWITDGSSTWSNPANWQGDVVADGSGFTANFNTNIATVRTVTLDSDRTLGNLVFSDNGASGSPWILNGASGTTTLTLATAGPAPVITATTNATIGVILAGSQGLIKDGGGTLTLTGANVYTGGTVVATGTLQVGGGGGTGSIVGDVVNTGTLSFNRNNTHTYDGVISGTGAVTANGGGTLILTGANVYTGGTSIVNGTTLQIGDGGSGGSIVGNVNGGSFTTLSFNQSDIYTFDGLIGGAGNVRQMGSGTLVLTQANTYSARTSVDGGSIRAANNGALQNSVVSLNVHGGLTFSSGITSPSFGGLTGTGDLALADESGSFVVLTVGATNQSSTYGGVLSGAGGLHKVGLGIQTLTGAHTYVGGTTVTNGTLQVGDGGSSGSIVGNVFVAPSGTLAVNRSGVFTLESVVSGVVSGTGNVAIHTGSLRVTDNLGLQALSVAPGVSGNITFSTGITAPTFGGLSGTGGFVLADEAGAPVLLTVGANNASTTNGGVLSGAGGIVKVGTGTLTLLGASTFIGGTTISAGTLQIGGFVTPPVNFAGNIVNNAALALSTVNIDGVISGSGSVNLPGFGTSILSGANVYTGGTTIAGFATLQLGNGGSSGSILGDVRINGTLAFNRSDLYVFNNVITGNGSLVQAGTGTTALTESNSYSGQAIVNAGAIRVDDIAALQNSIVTPSVNGGITFSAGITTPKFGALAGTGNIVLADEAGAPVALTVGRNNLTTTTTYGGVLSGAGSLTKTDGSTLIFTGANVYTGGTTILEGTLQIGAGGTTGDLVGNVHLASTATLVVNRSDAYTFNGVISGNGTVTQTGGGTLSFAQAGAVSATVNVHAGALRLAHNAAMQNGTVALNVSGGLTFAAGITAPTLGGLTGTGDIGLADQASSPVALSVGSNHLSTTYGGVLSGLGSLVKTGNGTFTLTAPQTYAGGTTISGGTLHIASPANTASPLGSGGIINNAILAFDHAVTVTAANVISGTGALSLVGTGTTVFMGDNTYTGVTTIADGTLLLGNGGGSGGIAGDAVVTSTLIVNRSGTFEYGGVLSGDGRLAKAGTGTLVLTQANTFSGTVTVNGGSIRLGDNGALQNSARVLLNVANGLTFSTGVTAPSVGMLSGAGGFVLADEAGAPVVLTFGGGGVISIGYSGVISGPGGLIKDGVTLQNLISDHTYLGGTTILGGTLTLGNGTTAGSVVGNVSVASTGTLAFNRSNDYTFNGVIDGAGGIRKSGAGILVLTQANTFSGRTTVSVGQLRVANDAALQNSTVGSAVHGAITFSAGILSPTFGGMTGTGNLALVDEAGTPVVLTVGGNNASTAYGGVLSGGGQLVKVGTGALTVTGANTHSGGTVINHGTLFISGTGAATSLGTGNVTNNGLLSFIRTQPLTFTNAVTGTGTLRQNGAGTTVLSGNNSFSGGTTILSGMLQAAHNNALGTGGVVIQNGGQLDVSDGITITNSIRFSGGGVLSGRGTIASNVTVSDGGVLSPGNSPGTMDFVGIVEFGPNGGYTWEINDVDAGPGVDPGWDYIDIVGQLMVTSTIGAKYHIDVTSLTLGNVSGVVHDFNPTLNYDWVIAMATGGVTGFDADFFQVNTSSFSNSFPGSFSVAQSGNGIVLHYTAVPEPGSIALAGVAAASIYLRRRRAKRIA